MKEATAWIPVFDKSTILVYNVDNSQQKGEKDMHKLLWVIYGPVLNPLSDRVQLEGILPNEKLTPKMARRAARIAQDNDSRATVWDKELGYGYRLYPHSHRKLWMDQ